MASCMGCICKFCAYNVNLDLRYFTRGEVTEACFNCDDCMDTDGHSRWDPDRGCYSGRWKDECDHFREPTKLIDMKADAARRSLRVIGGSSQQPKKP